MMPFPKTTLPLKEKYTRAKKRDNTPPYTIL